MEIQWQRALKAESGISKLTRFPCGRGFRSALPARSLRSIAIPTRFYRHGQWPNGRLVVQARPARGPSGSEKSGIEVTSALSPRVAITFGSAIGGLDAVIAADRLLTTSGKMPHPFTNPNSCINMVSGKISILTGATGPIAATITACATGSTSLIIGAMLLEQGYGGCRDLRSG